MMTYNQFVERPIQLKRRIEHQMEDVELKWAICQTTTSQLGERVQTSTVNKSEKSYLKYIEAKRKLDELSSEFDTASNELRMFLYNALNPDDADVLEWKYIEGKSLQEIAVIRNITYQSMKNKTSKAERIAKRRYQMLPDSTRCD